MLVVIIFVLLATNFDLQTSDGFAELNTRPELHQLSLLEGNGLTVRVVDITATVWETVALGLFFKSHDISRIKRDHPQQSIQAATTVFSEWIEGKGRQPKTWLTIMKSLSEAGLETVARDLKHILGSSTSMHAL